MRVALNDGRLIGYDSTGDGPAVVFLHPVGLSRRFWDDVTTLLPQTLRLVRLDLAGHGESDPLGEHFSLDDFANDVIECTRVLALGPVVLVGCSMGGMVAQGVAIKEPALVSGMLLTNTTHRVDPVMRPILLKRAEAARNEMKAVIDETIERWFSADVRRRQPNIVDRIRKLLAEAAPENFARCWQAIAALDYSQGLERISAPTIVVTGDSDRSSSPGEAALLARLLPRAELKVLSGGHLLPIEQPTKIATLIVDHVLAIRTGLLAEKAARGPRQK